MILPRPWSTVYGITGTPIHVPRRLEREALEPYRLLVESEMLRMTEAAERWAHEGRKPVRAELETRLPLRQCA